MKKVVLVSGNFTENGNITGYTSKGERVHVPAKQAENAGITKDNLKWPMYAFAGERTFDVLGEDEKPTGEKFTRLQTGSIYAERQSLINVAVEDATLDMEVAQAVTSTASAKGLSEKQVAALLESVI